MKSELKPDRNAFTIIELLVVISVIMLLVGLSLPAIQYARESSRRAMCANRLKEIGLAVNNSISVDRSLPRPKNTYYSIHTEILKFTEQHSLYNSINFECNGVSSRCISVNSTCKNTTVSLFVCPSEREFSGPGRTSYAASGGYGRQRYGANGPFSSTTTTAISSITDGLSETAAMAEWVPQRPTQADKTTVTYVTKDLTLSYEYNDYVRACAEQNPLSSEISPFGKAARWLIGGYCETLMNHDEPIGGNSCVNGSSIDCGSWTAGSRHPSGINLLFLDGHVRFLKTGTSLPVWRAIGTSSGAEVNTIH